MISVLIDNPSVEVDWNVTVSSSERLLSLPTIVSGISILDNNCKSIRSVSKRYSVLGIWFRSSRLLLYVQLVRIYGMFNNKGINLCIGSNKRALVSCFFRLNMSVFVHGITCRKCKSCSRLQICFY